MQRLRDYLHELLIRYWMRRTMAETSLTWKYKSQAVLTSLLLARSPEQVARMERQIRQ